MLHRRGVSVVLIGSLLWASSALADISPTYLGAFKAFSSGTAIAGGGLTFYPSGNGGAGSLFISRSPTGSGKEIWELSIPTLVVTTDANNLNTATTLTSMDVSTNPNSLVWRSTDDRLYYASGATGSSQINFRYINRDGTGESTLRQGPAWHEGGFALCQVPDAWATAQAAGKNLLTIAPVRGILYRAVDPWNSTISDSELWRYGTNPQMTGYDYGDGYCGMVWAEFAGACDFVFCGANLPGPNATLWFVRVSDFENRASAVPQPYQIVSVQDRMFTTSKVLYGLGYDSSQRILYAYEGGNNLTIVHAWQLYDSNAKPSTTADLATSNPTQSSVTLTWTAPTDDNSTDGHAASYDLRYSTSTITDANWSAATQVTGLATPAEAGTDETTTVSGLAANTTYYFAIKACDGAGHYSLLSNVASATTQDTTPPATIENLAAGSPTGTSLTLTWTAPGDDGSTGTATSYDIRYSTSTITEANWASATQVTGEPAPAAAGTNQSMTVLGLSNQTTYYFAMKTSDEVPNVSTLSNVATGTTLDVVPPAAVNTLATNDPGMTSITLTWTAPGDDGNTGTAGSYDIRYSTSTINDGNWASATQVTGEPTPTAAGTNQSMTVSGLTAGVTYYFAIKALDEVPNTSALSNVASGATLPPDSPPVAVTDLASSNLVFNAATLTWTAPYDDYGTGHKAAGYDLRYSTAAVTEGNWGSATQVTGLPTPATPGTADTVTVNGLLGSTTYYFAIKSYDATDHYSTLSNVLSVTTPVAGPVDVNLTYLGAFKAFSSSAVCSGGGMTYYPGGNGGAGSLFIGRGSTSGSGKEIWEISIPTLVATTDINALNTATTLSSLDTNLAATGLVWRSTDDRLYYSTAATGYGQMSFRYINRDGTGESDLRQGPAWHEGGFALCQVPDAWAAAQAYDKNILTIAPVRGILYRSVEPLNSPVTDSELYRYGGNQMTSYDVGDNYYGIAWVQVGNVRDLIVSGYDLPGPNATLWCTRVLDFENRGSIIPQPYQILSVQDHMFTSAKCLSGLTYDSVRHILYAYEATTSSLTIVHAWQTSDSGHVDAPPSTITNLTAGSPTGQSITLTWTAPSDDFGTNYQAAGYDIRYSTSTITEANWGSATQVNGEPTPAAPGTGETMVVSGLTGSTTYYFAIKASDASGHYASLSNVPSATTEYCPDAPPTTITNLASSGTTSQSVTLTWSAPSDDLGANHQAAGYDIRYSTSTITDTNWASASQVTGEPPPATPGTGQSMTVTGLSGSTTYYFAIKSYDGGNQFSALSNVISATTQAPDSPPTAISNLATGTVVYNSVSLAWSAPSDDYGTNHQAAGYDLRYSTSTISEGNWASATQVSGEPTPGTPGTGQSMTVTGLSPSTTYYFAIKSYDSASHYSALSNVVSAATPEHVYTQMGYTYLGAFRALPGTQNVYNGGMTFYPAGNGGAGSLFICGYLRHVYEITIPSLVITTNINSLNTATTLRSFIVSTQSNGLVWRSTDDRLYYSCVPAPGAMLTCQSINRDGTGETAATSSLSYIETGAALTQVPDSWAAAQTGGVNLLTVGVNNGPVISAIDPWNSPITINRMLKYEGTPMVSYDWTDGYSGMAWASVGAATDFVFTGHDVPANAATLWFMRVSDFEGRAGTRPQPYKIRSVQDRIFTTSHNLSGATYDSTNHILYAYEGVGNGPVIVHAWSLSDTTTIDNPPPAIANLAGSNPTYTSATLSWTAPLDDRSQLGDVAGYDVRYSTSPIVSDADFAAATQATGEPTPRAPDTSQRMVVTGLTHGTLYYFAIKSYDTAFQYSPVSNTASITLADDTVAPGQVTDLVTGDVRSTRLQLSWTATGDDGTTGTAYSYDVRRSTSPINAGNFASATVVAQNLIPKASGQAETLVVTGLSPSTTYYFAVKVGDTIPNWSTISNVVSATTVASPTTPPAAVSNLAASGTDGVSATLTWTAPADANGKAAGSYEVRYSTSTITAGNWAAATLAPNALAPKSPSSAETFTVVGLQPSTTYYFALKAIDEVGNTSSLSNVPSCTTPVLGNLPVVTTMSIVEKAGTTTTNYPVTLSMVFRQGDVASNVTVRVNGQVLPTQTDVKVRWSDNSLRHALVSFVVPQLQANQTLTVEILSGGPNYNTGWMTRDQLLASDFEAVLSMVADNAPASISAREILRGLSSVDYWMQGSIATEFIVRDWNTNAFFGQLNASYRVRVYPTAGMIRVSTVVENTWINTMGNITYDFALSLGRSSPQTVLSRTGFTQWQSSRWHKVFWQGTTPPTIEVRYNLAYMIQSGSLPHYDTSLTASSSAITSVYNSWNSSPHDIMENGQMTTYMPQTGGRDEIGPYPKWTSLYLSSMDYRLAQATINYGDLSGSIPIHYRETDPARSFYRHPVSIDDRPTVWFGNMASGGVSQADQFPPAVSDDNTVWTVDRSHQSSLAYVPYLITGDLYYLEEMHFWACYDLGASNSGYRGGSLGWILDQTRGIAWAFRNLVDAAAMTPTTMPEKTYMDTKVGNNISKYTTDFLSATWPTVRTYGGSDYAADSSLDPATCSSASGIWQDDYLTWSFIHAYQLGYPTLSLAQWGAQGVIDRFTDWPGWNRYRGAVYAMPVKGWDANHNPALYQTWADVNNGFADKVGPSSFSGNPNGYDYAARGVLGLAGDLGLNAQAAYNWASGQMPMSTYASDTRWAFVPVTP